MCLLVCVSVRESKFVKLNAKFRNIRLLYFVEIKFGKVNNVYSFEIEKRHIIISCYGVIIKFKIGCKKQLT